MDNFCGGCCLGIYCISGSTGILSDNLDAGFETGAFAKRHRRISLSGVRSHPIARYWWRAMTSTPSPGIRGASSRTLRNAGTTRFLLHKPTVSYDLHCEAPPLRSQFLDSGRLGAKAPCPHPGINMPDGWENEEASKRYIHALNVGLDANYRLKRKDVSGDDADPGLTHEADVEPKSTCSRHDAVNLVDVRPGQGFAATGVATVECTRHNMKRPSALCDLQKGEKYSNMDYIFGASLVLFGLSLLRTFLISYDIACQWSVHLISRLLKINPEIPILHPDSESRFVVPKFHLPAHIPSCQTRFAFMFTKGAGLGDGEAPERGWADSNPLGPSTREMGPGTRRDTLDYHYGDYNWRHITKLANSLSQKMKTATSGVAERVISHREFVKGLEADQVAEWWKLVTAWEKDPVSIPNPFDFTIATPSQSAVRKALSEEESAMKDKSKHFSLDSQLSPSELISRGIDLESDMRSLKQDMKKTWDHSRDRELTRVQLKSNTITRKVEAWYRVLQLQIPSSILLRENHATSSKSVKAYELPLWLPSEIGSKAPFPEKLGRIEFRLREAQAQDALTTIRRNLQRRVTVWDLKDRWLRGQGSNTKALNLLSTLQNKIRSAKEEYTKARSALIALAPILGEKHVELVYLPLEDKDLVPLSADSVTAPSQGQTRRVGTSWIWRHPSAANDDLTAYETETRKIEWAKSRARANRYQEEIQIVQEEMNRTLRFFTWKERKWLERATAREEAGQVLAPEYIEGLHAYSTRQAAISRGLHNACRSKWSTASNMIKRAKMEIENPKLIFERKEKEMKRIFSRAPTSEKSESQ
ncbi:hypothetical protein NMY22_g8845 [Coprinellus aureogranulatus]|nr:hypothetical protein NMY22_g8845 [Coprinellus aureogranulatus]